MTQLKKMYKGVANSPSTYLSQALVSEGTVIYVADGNVFGTIPNLAVIGDNVSAETILINSKREDGGYNVTRATEGAAKAWEKNTVIARNFTNLDHATLIDNVENIKSDLESVSQKFSENENKISELSTKQGSLENLTTQNKNNLVLGINEVKANVEQSKEEITQIKQNAFKLPEEGTDGQFLKKVGNSGQWANIKEFTQEEKESINESIMSVREFIGKVHGESELIDAPEHILFNVVLASEKNDINGISTYYNGTQKQITLKANQLYLVYKMDSKWYVMESTDKSGDLINLKTSAKDNLVNAVNEVFQNAGEGKTKIANALAGKGANVTSNSTWDEMKSAIENLQGNTFLANQVVPIRYGSSYHNPQNIQVTDIKPDKMYANAVDTNKLFGLPISYRCILNPVNGQIYVHNNYYLKVYDKDFNIQRNLNTGIRDCNYGFHFMQDSSKRVQVIMWGKEGVKYWDSSNPSSIYDFSLPTSLNDIVGMVNDPTGNFFMIIYKYSNKLACRIYQNLSNRWTKYTREDVYFVGSLNSAQQVKTLHMGFTNMVPNMSPGIFCCMLPESCLLQQTHSKWKWI